MWHSHTFTVHSNRNWYNMFCGSTRWFINQVCLGTFKISKRNQWTIRLMFVHSLNRSFDSHFLWVWARWFCDRLHFCYHLSIDLVIYHFSHVDLSHTHTRTCRCKDLSSTIVIHFLQDFRSLSLSRYRSIFLCMFCNIGKILRFHFHCTPHLAHVFFDFGYTSFYVVY